MSASKRQESENLGMTKKLREKWNEALQAVLPIIAIVLVLCFVIAPISSSILLCFLLGAVLLLAGMMLFTLGAELAMSPMGERVGTCLTKSRKLPVVIGLSFLLGFIITISEPDLQVLANQVPAVPNMTLILSVACGVGAFLVVALMRMLFSVALPPLLLVFYGVVFVLAMFVPKAFLSVAFDSGGVTTGPMTVPFIMALGVRNLCNAKRPPRGGRQLRSRSALLHRTDPRSHDLKHDLQGGQQRLHTAGDPGDR